MSEAEVLRDLSSGATRDQWKPRECIDSGIKSTTLDVSFTAGVEMTPQKDTK